jgi:hypothetical protein
VVLAATRWSSRKGQRPAPPPTGSPERLAKYETPLLSVPREYRRGIAIEAHPVVEYYSCCIEKSKFRHFCLNGHWRDIIPRAFQMAGPVAKSRLLSRFLAGAVPLADRNATANRFGAARK